MLGRCRIQILLQVLFPWVWYLILPFAPLLVCLKALLIPFFAGIVALQQQFHMQCQLLGVAEKSLNAVTSPSLKKTAELSGQMLKEQPFWTCSCSDYN